MYMRRPVNNSFKVDEYAWSMFVVIVASFSIFNFWWLVRATYVVDGLFLGDCFWKVVGTVRIHVSHVQGHSHVGLTHMWRGHSRVGLTHVWRGHSRVGLTHVWRGHSRVGLTHVWRGHSRVGVTHVWRGHSRVGVTHVWRGHSHVGVTHVWRGHWCVGVTHVWRGHSHVGLTHVWRGHLRVGFTHVWRGHSHVRVTHVWRGHSRVEGAFTCGSYSHVEGTFTCGSYSRVEGPFMCWGFLTGGTSHQSEILHSLIFWKQLVVLRGTPLTPTPSLKFSLKLLAVWKLFPRTSPSQGRWPALGLKSRHFKSGRQSHDTRKFWLRILINIKERNVNIHVI